MLSVSSSAPQFEILDTVPDVGIVVCSRVINNFCNTLMEELSTLDIVAQLITDSPVDALVYVILVDKSTVNVDHDNITRNNAPKELVLLDHASFSDFSEFGHAYARLTTDTRLQDAKCLARNIHMSHSFM